MKKRLLTALLSLCLLLNCGIVTGSLASLTVSAAPQEALVEIGGGKLKVEVCTENIIRVRYSPDGIFREKTLNTYVAKTKWENVDYTVTERDGILTVATDRVRVEIQKETGRVSFYDTAGQVLLSESSRSASPQTLDGVTYYRIGQSFQSPDGEYLYGFGNVDSVVGIKNVDVSISQSNTKKRTPMFFSNRGYGILFDITSNGALNWSDGGQTYTYTGAAADSMDYYFFYGPDADSIIAGYREVTGQATMLPKNAFGYVQSRNRYGSQKELLEVVDTFREKGIPLDNIVIDYYWWKGDFNNILEWGDTWTDPVSMMEQLHEKNVTASISIWPSFKEGTRTYQTIHEAGALLKTPSNFGFNYDPSSAANRLFYWNMINQSVFSKGLDSIWLDADEPETSNWVGSGEKTAWGDSRIIGTIYPLLSTRGVYEGQRALAGNTKRVNTLSRGAVAGIQRYGIQSWSGDIPAGWAQLQKEIRGAMNFSAAGLPYFSTDTGGYFGIDVGDPDNREMFFRWLQFSTFNSIMRVHGEGCVKEPWQFGAQYEAYITEYINLRERLIPYIYSLAGQVTQDGYTMVRPLVFDFREDAAALTVDDQFMFGPSLMVCPVYTPGARTRDVYLPAGVWTDFWTGKTFESRGETFTVSAPLKRIPLFVRGGSILPMGPFQQYATESADPTEIRVYMGADSSFTLYEDEGDNYNYENGKFSEIPFTWNEKTRTLTVGDREGSFDGMLKNRTFNVVFVQPDYGAGIALSRSYQATIAYTGKSQSVTFDADWEIPAPDLDEDTLPVPDPAPVARQAGQAMVGEWSFSEGEGAKVRDTSGNFNSGSVVTENTAGVWTSEGKQGNAIYFSGGTPTNPGTFVEVNNSPSLGMTEEISFSAWVNFAGGGHANIVNKGGNGNNNPGFSLILLDGNRLQLEIQTDRDANGRTKKTTAVSTVCPGRGSWHQVAFTWKSKAAGGDGIVRLYVDGRQTSVDSVSGNYFEGPIGQNSSGLRFGSSDVTEPNYPNYFHGIIDEARLFNYALSAEDIAALSREENILVANPQDVTLLPVDGGITVNWTDPETADLKEILVICEPEAGDEAKTYTVPKGTGTLNLTNLTNGAYYHVALKTVLTNGKQSSGVYLVCAANPYPARIDCVVTHDDKGYGYVVNTGAADLIGTLTVQVLDMAGGGKVISTAKIEDFAVPALDMRRFTVDTGAYADGQAVRITYVDSGKTLANPMSADRERVYEPPTDLAALREALLKELSREIDETLYTALSLEAWKTAKLSAQAVYDNPDATGEQLSAAIQSLKSTLVVKPPYTLGDINGDEVINTTDARLALQYAVEKIDMTEDEWIAGDVNQDGIVNTTDARLILQYAVEKIDEFPAKQ